MKRFNKAWTRVLIVAGILAMTSALGWAQDDGGGRERGEREGRRGRRERWTPEMMRQRMLERTQERLEIQGEEWEAIKPLVEAVMDKQSEARELSGMRFRRGRDNDEGAAEVKALREAIDADNPSPDDIKAKLEALRAARKQKEAELDKARKELQSVLTVKQEAQLVLSGFLE